MALGASPIRHRAVGLAILCVLFVTTIVLFGPFARLGVDPFHDGAVLKPAFDVASGQVLYRDTFNIYGPLPTLLEAAVVRFVAPSLLAVRWLTVIFYGLTALGLGLMWRKLLPLGYVVLSLLIWSAFADFYAPDRYLLPWSSVFVLPFQALAIWSRLNAIDLKSTQRHTRWNFSAGAMTGLCALCRMPSGALLLIGLLISAPIESLSRQNGHRPRHAFLPILLGAATVFVPYVCYSVITRSIDEFTVQTVMWPYSWASGEGAAPQLLGLVRLTAESALLGLVVAVPLGVPIVTRSRAVRTVARLVAILALAAIAVSGLPVQRLLFLGALALSVVAAVTTVRVMRVRFACRSRDIGLIVATLLAATSLVQVYPVPDESHLWWSITPGVGVLMALARKAFRPSAATAVAMTFIAAAFLFTLPSRQDKLANVRGWVEAGPAPVLVGMRVPPSFRARTSRFSAEVRRAADNRREILNLGEEALWATFSHRLQNPDPYWATWGPKRWDDAERLHFIKTKRPVVITTRQEDVDRLINSQRYVVVATMGLPDRSDHYRLLVPVETTGS